MSREGDRWGDETDGPTAERGGERRSGELPQQVASPDGVWRRERPFGQFCHVLPWRRAGRGERNEGGGGGVGRLLPPSRGRLGHNIPETVGLPVS